MKRTHSIKLYGRVCRMPEGRPLQEALRNVVREIDCRLLQETDYAQAVRLITAAFILTGLRVQKNDLANIYGGVRVMHESTAYDIILDEGRLEGEIRLLLRLGRKRFGPADPAMGTRTRPRNPFLRFQGDLLRDQRCAGC